jgi:predicted dehydrogenase/threonine dehydrogenase-like Zn-dependent dehydrogenase
VKQVIQNFKSGDLSVEELPVPSVTSGFVLVRNHFSLISAGTERSTISTAKASLLGKARQRPDLVKQVIDTFRKQGFTETLARVRTKLDTLKELGYSSAGTVLLSMDRFGLFKPGDRVACGGGGYASHAEVVSVPQNLVVQLPDSVSLDWAAFTTLGAIALQGVRQAHPTIGNLVCVIGLGLLGQITAQILRANGCRVFGVDTAPDCVELARRLSCHDARLRSDPRLESEIDCFTQGHGFDSVIITAGSKSNDPVNLATTVLRHKGVLVIVGAVPMNISREPHFYRKELELKISCSYGPGRYDRSYEEGGQDYPYGYVRWTENRNMAAFVGLLEDRAVDMSPLISHVVDIKNAEKAYEIITGKSKERHIGILIKYSDAPHGPPPATPSRAVTAVPKGSTGIGFIGAGSFAQKYLIPYASRLGVLVGVVTSRGVSAKSAGDKFGFTFYSTDRQELLSNQDVSVVFIATRHDTHADLAVECLEAGKHVFVEKPLSILEDDLWRIADVARKQAQFNLMVGFNRRFAPLSQEVKQMFVGLSEPLLINYRINAGFIAEDHWIQSDQGGGRILGEVCHFVDLLQFLTDSDPIRVCAETLSTGNTKTRRQDNVVITISFKDGSVGVITYAASGHPSLGKERIEVFGGGMTAVIDNFRFAEVYYNNHSRRIKKRGKGFREEIDTFLEACKAGRPTPIPLETMLLTTATVFRVIDSLRTGLPQVIRTPQPQSSESKLIKGEYDGATGIQAD